MKLNFSEWQSNDAAFAFGVFSRDPGTDVLYDLAINDNLDLLPRPTAGLHAILSRIAIECNAFEPRNSIWVSDTYEISWLDREQIKSTCDAAIPAGSHQSVWYALGCAFAEWSSSTTDESLSQLRAAVEELPQAGSVSPIQELLDLLRVEQRLTVKVMQHLLEAPRDRNLGQLLSWDLVLAQGTWIREGFTLLPDQASFNSGDDAGCPAVALHDKDHVCDLLGGVTKRHIDNLVASGRMPEPVYLGRSPRWRSDVMQQWLSSDCPVSSESKHSAWLEKEAAKVA